MVRPWPRTDELESYSITLSMKRWPLDLNVHECQFSFNACDIKCCPCVPTIEPARLIRHRTKSLLLCVFLRIDQQPAPSYRSSMKFALRGHPCADAMCGSFALPLAREMKAAISERRKLSVETVCPDCGRRCSVQIDKLTRRDVDAEWLARRFPIRNSLCQTC